MAFKVVVSAKAHRQFSNAIEYYLEISPSIPAKFILAIENTYSKLSSNPFYAIRYKTVRAIPVKGFPYLLFFVIDEQNNEVKVLSCFHTSKSPGKYPN